MRLIKNKSSDNTINKVLEMGEMIPIKLKRDADIANPEIVLRQVEGLDFQAFNYCYIERFKRYYFIKSVDNINRMDWLLRLEVDVLQTFKDDILKSNAKYRAPISSGDFGNVSLDTVSNEYTILSGDVIEMGNSFVMTTMGDGE